MTTIYNITELIVNDFYRAIDLSKTYTNREIQKVLSDIYKAKNAELKEYLKTKNDNKGTPIIKKRGRPRKVCLDKNDNPKEKKLLTEYNLFVKNKYAELKTQFPEEDAKEILKKYSKIWQQQKYKAETVKSKDESDNELDDKSDSELDDKSDSESNDESDDKSDNESNDESNDELDDKSDSESDDDDTLRHLFKQMYNKKKYSEI